jgi:flavin-dependent dehydrogenase
MYDVAIIGGGPAGATLARFIGTRRKVLLLDRRDLASPPDPSRLEKCCGGLLAPDAQKTLAEFGLGLPGSVLASPQLFAVRAIDLPRKLERFYQRFYINIHREAFDRWLLTLVPEAVDVRTRCLFRSWESGPEGFRIRFTEGGETRVEEARVLVGADGAFSKVRRLAGFVPPPSATYFASQEFVETPDLHPYFTAVFDREVTDFYSWMIPKGEGLLIGTAVRSDKPSARRLALLKEKLAARGFRFGKVFQKRGAFLLRPRSRSHVRLGAGRIGLVGEAAGWVSPSSAEGLSYAFRSARSLAEAILEKEERFLGKYVSKTTGLRWNVLVKAMKSRVLYHPLARMAVMRLGIGSVSVVGEAPNP